MPHLPVTAAQDRLQQLLQQAVLHQGVFALCKHPKLAWGFANPARQATTLDAWVYFCVAQQHFQRSCLNRLTALQSLQYQ